MQKILVDNVTKVFGVNRNGGGTLALDRVGLEIADQEIVCLVGPSGCGKSTIVNMVAGFDAPSSGRVLVDGSEVRDAGPDRIVVFQTAALFPWLSVIKNIMMGPLKRGTPLRQCREDAARFMHTMQLEAFADHFPYQLSGGMRQRVQIASALINRPDVLLMDEPFVGLDFQTRLVMQELLLELWQEFHPTILFITHDIEEAIFLSDRLYVMTKRPGRIKEEIRVPFSKPRKFDLVTTSEFVAIKDHVFHLIREELVGLSTSQRSESLESSER